MINTYRKHYDKVKKEVCKIFTNPRKNCKQIAVEAKKMSGNRKIGKRLVFLCFHDCNNDLVSVESFLLYSFFLFLLSFKLYSLFSPSTLSRCLFLSYCEIRSWVNLQRECFCWARAGGEICKLVTDIYNIYDVHCTYIANTLNLDFAKFWRFSAGVGVGGGEFL